MFQNVLYWSYNVSLFLYTSVLLQVRFLLLHHQKNQFYKNCNQYLYRFNCTWVTTLSSVLSQTGSTMSKYNLQGNTRACRKKICRLLNPWPWFSIAFNPQCIARENHDLQSVSISTKKDEITWALSKALVYLGSCCHQFRFSFFLPLIPSIFSKH